MDTPHSGRNTVTRAVFWTLALFCFTPWGTPPLALALGLAMALTLGHPYKTHNSKAVKYLLQASVIGLGFGMNFGEVVNAGRSGVAFTAISIAVTLTAGLLLGSLLKVKRNTSCLIASGTAICGGSAIAAMAPVVGAADEEISVALGTVFILNAAALFIFPPIGHALGMSERQFGLWSAIAIHDTSSVVGAAARFGPEALKVATTVKLTRALWIIPLSLAGAMFFKNKSAKVTVPYFIFAFVLASLTVTALPAGAAAYALIALAAKKGLTLTLFLIGAGLSRSTIRAVGIKPVAQGIILWAFISVGSLLALRAL